jgi:hypothetical protein
MVLVGGCSFSCLAISPVALLGAVLPTVGPEPASFSAARPVVVLQGPAWAVLRLKTMVAQLARMSDLVFICCSLFVGLALWQPGVQQTNPRLAGSSWPSKSR